MKRRLFTILSALSLLLCVMTGVLWVRSYWADDKLILRKVGPHGPYGGLVCWAGKGRIAFGQSWCSPDDRIDTATMPWLLWIEGRPARLSRGYLPAKPPDSLSAKLGFEYNSSPAPPPKVSTRAMMLPFGAIFLLLVILSFLYTRRALRDYRARQPGCCATCGYDLRASTKQCPECGTPIPDNLERCSQDRTV